MYPPISIPHIQMCHIQYTSQVCHPNQSLILMKFHPKSSDWQNDLIDEISEKDNTIFSSVIPMMIAAIDTMERRGVLAHV